MRSPGSSISADASKVEIGKEPTYNICATVQLANASNKTVIWESSDPNVATVSQDGVISGNSSGRTTIRVTATDGSGVFVECAVWVDPVPVTSVAVTPLSLTMYLGYTQQFSAWYVLQHYKGCNNAHKPFVTRIDIEVPFSGTIN